MRSVLQDTQSRYEKLLEEVNQLQLNLKNVTAELQQARSQERFLCEEKEQLQNNLREFETNNQSQFQRVGCGILLLAHHLTSRPVCHGSTVFAWQATCRGGTSQVLT